MRKILYIKMLIIIKCKCLKLIIKSTTFVQFFRLTPIHKDTAILPKNQGKPGLDVFKYQQKQIYYRQFLFSYIYQILRADMNIYINLDNISILRLLFITQTVLNLPFIIASLVLYQYTGPNYCLYITFGNANDLINLGTWVFNDAFIRLAILAIIWFVYFLAFEIKCKYELVCICGNIIRFYNVFNFGWTITASVLFWGSFEPYNIPTYQVCQGTGFEPYLFVLLISNYITIPLNICMGGFRPKEAKNLNNDESLRTARGDTELVNKKQIAMYS